MTQYLPPNLLSYFAPRDPIPFKPPPDKLPHQKKTTGYKGVSEFLFNFEDPADTPPPVKIETREERQERKRKDKAEQVAYKLELDIASWAPHNNVACTTDPYKTLFVARLSYDTSESKIRREFEMYGPVRKVVIVHNEITGKPRGYAFIEYERERDMHAAYKHADGKKIDGSRVLVDVERGRTVQGWLPRRLGGGLGGTRRGGPEVNVKHSGREEPRGEDRIAERERERPERQERRRSRSRSRERRRRSRSRERHRGDRHKRERSPRERENGRDRDPAVNNEKIDTSIDGKPEIGPVEVERVERKERRRSRSRDRDRRRRRSRSRERTKRREHDRDRDTRGGERADRDERVKMDENTIPPENEMMMWQDGVA